MAYPLSNRDLTLETSNTNQSQDTLVVFLRITIVDSLNWNIVVPPPPPRPKPVGSKSTHRCVRAPGELSRTQDFEMVSIRYTIKPRCEPNESGAVECGAQSPAFRHRHRERREGEYGGTCGSGGGGLIWLRAPPAPQQADTLGTQGGGGLVEENNATLQNKNYFMILSEDYHVLLPVECVSCCTHVNDEKKERMWLFFTLFMSMGPYWFVPSFKVICL